MTEATSHGPDHSYSDFDERYQLDGKRFGVERVSLDSVPQIDLSPFVFGGSEAARAKVAREMREAAINIGFFYLRGHGFTPEEFDDVLAWGRRFFALPREEKERIHWNQKPGKGYIPPGGADANAAAAATADVKERLYFGREYAVTESEAVKYPSDSQWPDENALPGFRDFITRYTRKSVALAQKLGSAFAKSLDLPESYFADAQGPFGGTLVYNFYPHLPQVEIEKMRWNFSPHTDYGSFTILLQDELGGLQVRNAGGEWVDVVPIPGTLVVNIGDMLAMVTNDLYTSNLHRVVNQSGRERISLPMFVSPLPDTELRCLNTCQGPGNPPRYEPVKAGEYLRMLMDQYHRTGKPGIAPKTAARLSA